MNAHPPASQSPLNVAIVGATGAVGEVLLDVLDGRGFPINKLSLLASGRSSGSMMMFRGVEHVVREARPESFQGMDLVFFAATGALSRTLAPAAVEQGALVIDKSSTWRMDPDVALVVPEINPEALDRHRGIVACPNCTTIGVTMALAPIRNAAGLRSVVLTTLQAASGAGRDGVEELTAQTRAGLEGVNAESRVFPRPIAGNVLPKCEGFEDDGYTAEEHKLVLETRKILGDRDLAVTATCVRVPVSVGHSASMLIETERRLTPDEAREVLRSAPGVQLIDDPDKDLFPTPLDVAGRDEVLVGRIRRDLDSDRLWMWQVSDNLRKGAATNAVQTAEVLVERGRLLAKNAAQRAS